MPLSRFGGREDGATVVMVAFMMALFMALAALAVDSGILFSERRQQQSAADGAALAAIQFAKTGLASSNTTCNSLAGEGYAACRGAEEAMAVASGTLPGRYTDADWLACSDPALPSEFTQASAISPCINFTETFQRARVVLPGFDTDTSFGGAVGVDSVVVGANAEASWDMAQSADVWPFGMGPGASLLDHACLFSGSTTGSLVAPCLLYPLEGNFGKLDISLYGNSTYGTQQLCGNTAPNTKIEVNLVLGADHVLEPGWKHPGTVNDFDNCPVISNPVDEVWTKTGNASGPIEDGLYESISQPALEGRLRCKDGDAGENPWANDVSNDCVNVNSKYPETIDHTPLWDYFAPTGLVGTVCDIALWAVPKRELMETCLLTWKLNQALGLPLFGVELFTEDIVQSPRFGAIPIFNTEMDGGHSAHTIVDFVPVYLETTYFGCQKNLLLILSCDAVHSPGEASLPLACSVVTAAVSSCGWPINKNTQIEAVTAFVLDIDMLPESVRANFPGTQGTEVFNLSG